MMRLNSNNDQLSNQRLSVVMEHLAQICQRQEVTIGSLLHELNVYGHMLVCLLFAVPFLLPVPLPGLSTIFGFVIGMASLQVILGKDPWVPASWRNRKISSDILVKMFEAAQRVLRRTETLIKPRLGFFAHHPGFVRFNALVVLLTAALLSLPMPPGFNAPPALAIIVLTIGSLEKDGVMVIAGYLLAIINAILFVALFSLGLDGVKALLGLA
jgi:hypothetical protein